jgi:tRNA (guanine10-N2)-dimethyltransferase
VKKYSADVDSVVLEKKIGRVILNQEPGIRVDLRNPKKTFFGVLTSGRLVFGVQLAEIIAKPFVERRPKNKPFFHPSAMHAKLARSMVNLARSRAGELVLDPFCGTGSTLIEAGLIGCRVLGFDVQRRMIRGSMRNLGHFKVKPEGMVLADARNPPILRVDRVITDPPYGTSATTLKRSTRQIFEEVLSSAGDILATGSLLCLAAPKRLHVRRLAAAIGYRHVESHFVYVHRSLTREVVVFERV